MTEQEFLATKVMGWEIVLDVDYPQIQHLKDGDYYHGTVSTFDPRQNIKQAMMLLKQYPDWDVGSWDIPEEGNFYCNVFSRLADKKPQGDVTARRLEDAIVDAVLQAEGYEDE